jgi:hypothetical protein
MVEWWMKRRLPKEIRLRMVMFIMTRLKIILVLISITEFFSPKIFPKFSLRFEWRLSRELLGLRRLEI